VDDLCRWSDAHSSRTSAAGIDAGGVARSRYAASTIATYRASLAGLRRQRDTLLAKPRTRLQEEELARLNNLIAHREHVVAEADREDAERAMAEQTEQVALTALEREFAELPDKQLQELVDGAAFLLLIDAARQYGLVTGGPEVDVERCDAALRVGRQRGLAPRDATELAKEFLETGE
jgi:hypothetical protein